MANHHFVPRMYMRLFNNNTKFINGYNIINNRFYENSAIKSQCSRDNMYDLTLDESFQNLENDCSIILRKIIKSKRMPLSTSEEYDVLLKFIAVQNLRTPKTLQETKQKLTYFFENAFEGKSPDEKLFFGEELTKEETLKSIEDDAINFIFDSMSDASHLISDLSSTLLESDNDYFLFSDNPVVLYNKIYEEDYGIGTQRGIKCRGILFFLPISPKICILLYDKSTYMIKNRCLKTEDVSIINGFQYCNADFNLYFGDYIDESYVISLMAKYKECRITPSSHIEKFSNEELHEEIWLISHKKFYIKQDFKFIQVRNKWNKMSDAKKIEPNIRMRDKEPRNNENSNKSIRYDKK